MGKITFVQPVAELDSMSLYYLLGCCAGKTFDIRERRIYFDDVRTFYEIQFYISAERYSYFLYLVAAGNPPLDWKRIFEGYATGKIYIN